MLTYLQAAVIGLLQGVSELFPVSSLGHSVLVPAFIGGSWEHLVTESSTSTSETSAPSNPASRPGASWSTTPTNASPGC